MWKGIFVHLNSNHQEQERTWQMMHFEGMLTFPPDVSASSLAGVPRGSRVGCLWQQGKPECVQTRVQDSHGDVQLLSLLFLPPRPLPNPLEHSWAVPVLVEGRQSWAGTLPPLAVSHPCPACCQPWIDTRTQVPSKTTEFNLPFFHLLTSSINYLI